MELLFLLVHALLPVFGHLDISVLNLDFTNICLAPRHSPTYVSHRDKHIAAFKGENGQV